MAVVVWSTCLVMAMAAVWLTRLVVAMAAVWLTCLVAFLFSPLPFLCWAI